MRAPRMHIPVLWTERLRCYDWLPVGPPQTPMAPWKVPDADTISAQPSSAPWPYSVPLPSTVPEPCAQD